MLITFYHLDQKVNIDLNKGIDLSIPNSFDGKNPIFFNSKNPKVAYPKSNNFIGKISEGGTCNVPNVYLDIHCSGTHTECENHIKDSNIYINDVCPKSLIPSTLISVKSSTANTCLDNYHVQYEKNDSVIIKDHLMKKLKNKNNYLDALIIRTSLNNSKKKIRDYDRYPAPFFSNDAIKFLLKLGVKHLLVDLPSIDKANDNGKLGNHHIFFQKGKTISEFLYIPDQVNDGFGYLQIQIPNWSLDAAPSRPIFYPI